MRDHRFHLTPHLPERYNGSHTQFGIGKGYAHVHL